MSKLLCYDPKRRISAEEAGKHGYFLSVAHCPAQLRYKLSTLLTRLTVLNLVRVHYPSTRICSLLSPVKLLVRGELVLLH